MRIGTVLQDPSITQTESQVMAYVTFMKDKRYDSDEVDLYENADMQSYHVHVTWQYMVPGW